MPGEPVIIGVSACLLGEKVRYDGGDRRDTVVTGLLAVHFRLVPVCPEVECGMTVPREPMRLEGGQDAPRLVTHKSRLDLTDQLLTFTRRRVAELAAVELCGFVGKKGSPSCGVWRVPIHQPGVATRSGSGLFVAGLQRELPLLPVVEEGALQDPAGCDHFVERVLALGRWREFCRTDGSAAGLVSFHARHKYQLMAHHPVLARSLGKLVAEGARLASGVLLGRYGTAFMSCLAYEATVRKHVNALQHIAGYFKRVLTAEEKAELQGLIDDFRRGLVPRLAPMALLRQYVCRFDQPYLLEQTYLASRPGE